MSGRIINTGLVNTGKMKNTGKIEAGTGSKIHITGRKAGQEAAAESDEGVDIGVITVIPEATQAIAGRLGLRPETKNGLTFNCGSVDAGGKAFTVAACQMLKQGERSVGPALEQLRKNHNPQIIVLTDIGGGIQRQVRLGEVVISTQVVGYDLRKETPDGTIRRGDEWQAPAEIGHAINDFFKDNGYPAEIEGRLRKGEGHIRIHESPVGSGNAVVASKDSEIVKWLLAYNDKILAIDMESSALAHALHDLPATERHRGWLIIRGISDHADEKKNDKYRRIACFNAAATLDALLPYLPLTST
jgi:adenosylhomocysteine nucleosidase